MRDKLLLLVYRYARWRHRRNASGLVSLQYLNKLFDYLEYEQVTKYYRPSLGLRTVIQMNHRNGESLLSRFSNDLETMKKGEYITAPSYERKVINLDDWLVSKDNRPYNPVAYIDLIKTYVKSYEKVINAKRTDDEWRDYYARRANNHLEDIVVLLETMLNITH